MIVQLCFFRHRSSSSMVRKNSGGRLIDAGDGLLHFTLMFLLTVQMRLKPDGLGFCEGKPFSRERLAYELPIDSHSNGRGNQRLFHRVVKHVGGAANMLAQLIVPVPCVLKPNTMVANSAAGSMSTIIQ